MVRSDDRPGDPLSPFWVQRSGRLEELCVRWFEGVITSLHLGERSGRLGNARCASPADVTSCCRCAAGAAHAAQGAGYVAHGAAHAAQGAAHAAHGAAHVARGAVYVAHGAAYVACISQARGIQ